VSSEQLTTRHIIRELETTNLRSILTKRKSSTKEKRAVLKGQFHISTKELRDAVVAAEKETERRSKKTRGKGNKDTSYEAEIELDYEEDIEEEDSNSECDYIVVDVN